MPFSTQSKPLTVADAQAALDKLAGDRARLVGMRTGLEERLETAKREMGERYLNGDRSHLKEVSSLAVELEALERALSVLDRHTEAAQGDLQRATVGDLRTQAEQKRKEMAALNIRTAKVLADLGALEEVRYTHSILCSQPLEGSWMQRGGTEPPLEYQGIPELQLNIPVPEKKIAVPRSRRLRMEAEELEEKAEVLEKHLS